MSIAEDPTVRVAARPRPRIRSRTWFASARDWLRERLSTTPGRLWLLAVSLALGAILFGAIATYAEHSRSQAAHTIRTQTEPLLVDATALYTALSDANATATTTFLQGGLEPASRTARYAGDLNGATSALAALAGSLGTSPAAGPAIARLTGQLPVYTGLIATARANNRQGFPVGAAYLRRASALLGGSILPAANQLYTTVAKRLSDAYASGTASAALLALAVVAAAALALLLVAQRFLLRASRRILNPPIVAGTLVLAVVSIWALVGLLEEGSSLNTARRESDAVEALSATRVLISRAQSDQSLTLVNRGSDQTDPADFTAVLSALTRRAGPLDELGVLARQGGTGREVARIDGELAAYRTASAAVAQHQQQGLSLEAASIAARRSGPAAAKLDGELDRSTAAAQGRFAARAADATSSLSGLWLAIPALTLLALALSIAGLRPRIEEYR